jgi:hypothetical protein
LPITLHGENKFARLWIDGKIQTDIEAINYKDNPQDIEWTNTTVLLSFLYNSLEGGIITNLPEVLEGWQVYKRKTNDSQDKFICDIPSTITNIRDYLISNKESYIITVYPYSSTFVGTPIYSNVASVEFDYFSLTDIITNETFKFMMNTEEGNIVINGNTTVNMTNQTYAVIFKGIQQFKSGTFTALIGSISPIDGITYTDTIVNRENLINFLNNNNEKIYKNLKGDCWRVQTNTTDFNINNRTHEKIQTITFQMYETGSTDDLAVYEEIASTS